MSRPRLGKPDRFLVSLLAGLAIAVTIVLVSLGHATMHVQAFA
jgi:hypothetical protein